MVYRDLTTLWKAETRARKAFFDGIEDGVKTEFINGATVVHLPDRLKHIVTRMRISGLLHTHCAVHRLGFVADEKLLVCLTRNDYMPDVVFFGPEKAALIEPEQMRFPAPDLVAEVLSPSTRRRDRGVKFQDYAAHGVQEYWVLDPAEKTVEIFHLNLLGEYALAAKVHGDQEARSTVVKGFKFPARAAFEPEANLAALKKILR